MLPPQSGQALQNAFETGQLEEFVAKSPPGGDAMTACKLTLEYAQPDDDSPLSYPIYATIEDLPTKKAWYWPKQARRTYVRQAALTTSEVLTLRPLFPKLARLLETHHEALRDLPASVLPASTDLARAEDV